MAEGRGHQVFAADGQPDGGVFHTCVRFTDLRQRPAAKDLTALSGGPPAAGDPVAYVTDFPGQGPTAHFVYRADDGNVHELFYIAARVPDSPN
jgi:hypothetical protein